MLERVAFSDHGVMSRSVEGARLAAPVTTSASALAELCDVPGVIGALVVSQEGDLQLAHLPRGLMPRARAAAPRLAVTLDALSAGRTMSRYCLRFYEQRLHVLTLPDAFLCVLSELWSSSPILKMAMTVTARRLA